MDVLDSTDKLLVNADGSLLMKSLMLNNIVEKFTIDTVLHNEVQLCLCLNDLVQLNHIWMSDFLEYFDLSRDAIYVFPVFNACLFKYFNRHVFLCQDVLCHLDLAESALAQTLAKNVMTKFSAFLMRVFLFHLFFFIYFR